MSAVLALPGNAPLPQSKRHYSVAVRNNMQSFATRNHTQAHTHCNTETLTVEMHANVGSVKKHRHEY